MHEFRGESFREYKDKGYSGKNTDRPQFQSLIHDIENGLISAVVVYKLDRISRSIIDFANMMEMFQKNKVEFVSATEKFDTSTPLGRAMLNICIVFAQLERETIQRRVQDAYYSRCEKSFHMGGITPYGYKLEPTTINGIKTKKLVVDSVMADQVKMMFEMYANPHTSFGDVVRCLAEQGITINGGEFCRATLSRLLRNPIYAQADLDLYDFFKSQGAAVVNGVADFTGTNGCYLFNGRDVTEKKSYSLKDQILVIAPHAGIISSETWLTCRKKLMNNTAFSPARKAKNTWLAGKIKCAKCGTSLTVRAHQTWAYLHCRLRVDSRSCEGCGTLKLSGVENAIHKAMCRKVADYQELTRSNSSKANPKLTALKVSLAQVEAEIDNLLESLKGANTTLLSYANKMIEELDGRKQLLCKQIADMSTETIAPNQIERISVYLDKWTDVSFDDKRVVIDGLITSIKAANGQLDINWKI